MSQPAMRYSERDETELDIPLMDLLDRWELPHKIQDSQIDSGVLSELYKHSRSLLPFHGLQKHYYSLHKHSRSLTRKVTAVTP